MLLTSSLTSNDVGNLVMCQSFFDLSLIGQICSIFVHPPYTRQDTSRKRHIVRCKVLKKRKQSCASIAHWNNVGTPEFSIINMALRPLSANISVHGAIPVKRRFYHAKCCQSMTLRYSWYIQLNSGDFITPSCICNICQANSCQINLM